MQLDPEKTINNYNEFQSISPHKALLERNVELRLNDEESVLMQEGISLVESKVRAILGEDNSLTRRNLDLPKTRFVDSDPKNPNFAGYFSPSYNEITIVNSHINGPLERKKVFIHEYLHFLSHNGLDDSERISQESPLSTTNNVGFQRYFGLDIRARRQNETTGDYFLSFNEAVTEQLAIDILPNIYQSYGDYRDLLNQVIDDTAQQKLGSNNNDGNFKPWSKEQIKDYIYQCFFRGNLSGFTQLLKTTYKKYDISEQQFGLMTHKNDLPTMIEKDQIDNNPNDPTPSPTQIAAMVQHRLDLKRPEDYITDVISPEEADHEKDLHIKYGMEYDTHVKENRIVTSHKETIEGKEYEIDSLGYFIYRGEESAMMFEDLKSRLDILISQASKGTINAEFISEQMDQMLFNTYFTSMISDGFRDFYIYKHSKVDTLQ